VTFQNQPIGADRSGDDRHGQAGQDVGEWGRHSRRVV
jgi:hypothetical protein